MRGCSTCESKRTEVTLSERKLKEKGDFKFRRVSGAVNRRSRDGVALLLCKRVFDGVVEHREVSARQIQ